MCHGMEGRAGARKCAWAPRGLPVGGLLLGWCPPVRSPRRVHSVHPLCTRPVIHVTYSQVGMASVLYFDI